MHIIAILDRVSLATHGYVRLTRDQLYASASRSCDTSTHFRSHVSAALCRDRFETLFPELLAVQQCLCPVGKTLESTLGEPNSAKAYASPFTPE